MRKYLLVLALFVTTTPALDACGPVGRVVGNTRDRRDARQERRLFGQVVYRSKTTSVTTVTTVRIAPVAAPCQSCPIPQKTAPAVKPPVDSIKK